MSVADSRTVQSGNSEVLGLPKTVAFGRELEVTIVRSGDVLTIFPKRPSIKVLVERLAALPRPTAIEVRDEEEFDERRPPQKVQALREQIMAEKLATEVAESDNPVRPSDAF